ncbi:hypothetical protein N780_15540 [Pontibacillus chungwhensis BH030062]|uniref:Group-specific protein n=1 Tax=Pontibacillus chungwhensis BH030062 TaxID=1385513 RepID=A0A0A2UZ43_9BACI|nr:nucleoside 2-deoxyribosyltransferase [Pontibacillus chungwhensis]KGP91791.1 hypothetical protein N780_15540 [Pontibacillus chungwhensis BH030062]
MKYTIASGFQNRDQVRYVRDKLNLEGFVHTYDWTQNDRATSKEALVEIGQKEKYGVKEADLIVVLLPGGKGTHIEFGMGIGLNKKVILYAPHRDVEDFNNTSTFSHLPEVQSSDSLDKVINMALEWRGGC